MEKIFQIFISSTYEDLKDERQVAVQKVLECKCIPAGMELFTAQSKSQWEIIKKWIDKSDIYLIILGGRYGSIDETTNLSYTEMEYNYAVEKHKPIISLVLSEDYLKSRPEDIQNSFELANEKYKLFRDKVKSKMVKIIKKQDDIGFSILQAIKEIQEDEDIQLTGWVRGDFSRIEEKFKIGQLSLNELNNFLSKIVFGNYPLEFYNMSPNMTALDFYKYLLISEDIYNVSTLNKSEFKKFVVGKVVPIFEKLGLVEYKPLPGVYYAKLHYTELGLKYNQLLCKFIDN